MDIPWTGRRKEVVRNSQLYTLKENWIPQHTDGGTLQRNWSPSILEHQCCESWNSDKKEEQRHHTLQCGCFELRTLISYDSLSKSAQYPRSSLKLMKSSFKSRMKKSRLRTGSWPKKNEQFLKNVKPQEVISLVQTLRGDDPASGNRLRECLQNFDTLEKSIQFTKVCKNGRRWWFWRSNSSMHRVFTPSCWVRFQNFCNDSRTRFQDKLQSVQFFKLKSFRILASTEFKFKVPSTTTPDRNSWVVICRRKNRYVDELHLNDPDHHPTISKLRLERFTAKESELCSTEMEQSHIGETHATQFEIPTNLVYNCSEKYSNWTKDVEWHFILACQQFRRNTFEAEVLNLVMRLVRRDDQHERETGSAVHWKWMGPKLRRAFRKAGGQKFSDSDWLQHIYKGSNKTRFQYCKKNPHIYLIVHSCSSRTHWWELDSAWVDGTRRYSSQMERILVSSRMLLWCHFNPQIRTHRWRTRKQRMNTDHLVHTSQPVRGQSRRMNLVSRNFLSTRKTLPKDSSDSITPRNQEFDQSCVSSSGKKLTRITNPQPTLYSLERQQDDTPSCSTRKLVRNGEFSSSASAKNLEWGEDIQIGRSTDGIPQNADLRPSVLRKSLQEPAEKVESRRRGTSTRIDDQCIDLVIIYVDNDEGSCSSLTKLQWHFGSTQELKLRRTLEFIWFHAEFDIGPSSWNSECDNDWLDSSLIGEI